MDKQFDRRANQYIFEYEGVDPGSADDQDDDLENLDDEMEALVVDIPPSPRAHKPRYDTEAIITSFGAIEHAEVMISDLTNRSFDHSFTGADPTILDNPTIESDPFTYIITERC